MRSCRVPALVLLCAPLLARAASVLQGNCGAGTGIASPDGVACCPVSCGACDSGRCGSGADSARVDAACCPTFIAQSAAACGSAPCVISGSAAAAAVAAAAALPAAVATAAAAAEEQRRQHGGVDVEVEVERALAESVTCPDKSECKSQTSGVKATCGAGSACGCPKGFTWIADKTRKNVKYGYCPADAAVCPDGKHFCRPVETHCTKKNKCACAEGYTFVAVDDAFTGKCIPNDRKARCPDGTVCKEKTGKQKVTCARDNTCVCVAPNRVFSDPSRDARTGTCDCGDTLGRPGAPCGGTKCCAANERCYGSSGGGGGGKACAKPLACAKGQAPCGHARAGTSPTPSTVCCGANQVCVVGSGTATKCVAQRACGAGQAACGRTYTQYSNAAGVYFEATADTKCCAAGEQCYFDKKGVSKCLKPVACAKGRKACGGTKSPLKLKYAIDKYYPSYTPATPNNVCCKAGQACQVSSSGGAVTTKCG
ncbi:hypothetical protein JKP88DRAFT_229592 [Tribonema minus]|uniref:Uncharacterized protein n=1 Tax=Tribonema minus TaxID=303371 RepID=A0A835YGL9_9STRA|nr:hypothetical protein JKP88DRAFT_229592 [Tribonema minus]